jgi:hypothetical protein
VKGTPGRSSRAKIHAYSTTPCPCQHTVTEHTGNLITLLRKPRTSQSCFTRVRASHGSAGFSSSGPFAYHLSSNDFLPGSVIRPQNATHFLPWDGEGFGSSAVLGGPVEHTVWRWRQSTLKPTDPCPGTEIVEGKAHTYCGDSAIFDPPMRNLNILQLIRRGGQSSNNSRSQNPSYRALGPESEYSFNGMGHDISALLHPPRQTPCLVDKLPEPALSSSARSPHGLSRVFYGKKRSRNPSRLGGPILHAQELHGSLGQERAADRLIGTDSVEVTKGLYLRPVVCWTSGVLCASHAAYW